MSRWQSLLVGLAVVLLIVPINIIVSKRYASAQDKLMKIRDQKMAAVSEALQGIKVSSVAYFLRISYLLGLRYKANQIFGT